MLIVSAVGNKSKLIHKRILCEVNIGNQYYDCIFIIIPKLLRPWIIGIHSLMENECVINL